MRPSFRTAACIIVVALASCSHADGTNSSAAAVPSVGIVVAHVGTYVERVSAVGRVGAPAGTASKLAFAEPGILRAVDVQIGDRVAAGQAVAQLDTGGLALAAQQAEADARAAAANAQQAAVDRTTTKTAVDRAALQREESLYAAGIAALKDVQAARAQLAADRADAATASAQVSAAQAQTQSSRDRAAMASRDLANGTLRAPQGGVVTALFKRPGEAVDMTTPVLAIGPDSAHDITLDVTVADAVHVRVGDPVQLRLPGTELRGTGSVVGVSRALDPTTQSATVVVSGVPSDAPAGSAVQASIVVGRRRGIVVPEAAIVQDPQSGQTVVFVESHNAKGTPRFSQRAVRVAHANATSALIASGVRPGEPIASQGAFALLAPAGGS